MIIDDFIPENARQYIDHMGTDEHADLKRAREHVEQHASHSGMMIDRQVARMLQMLIKLTGAKTCLEVGTFYGYSALTIAMALPEQGQLITLEKSPEQADIAQQLFDASNKRKQIHLIVGDALTTIPTLTMMFDFIFIDADKRAYPIYFDLLIPKLRAGGLMVVDNALFKMEPIEAKTPQGQAVHELMMKAKSHPDLETVLVPIRDGLLLLRKKTT
jgi:caffeoyl-CoA O-methyltransferase